MHDGKGAMMKNIFVSFKVLLWDLPFIGNYNASPSKKFYLIKMHKFAFGECL